MKSLILIISILLFNGHFFCQKSISQLSATQIIKDINDILSIYPELSGANEIKELIEIELN